jgi:hypothetical protein
VVEVTLVFPEAFPDDYCTAHADHWCEEINRTLTKATPFFVQRMFGYQAPLDKIKEKFFLVPAE